MEIRLHIVKNRGRKAPEVHGHHTVAVQFTARAVRHVGNAAVGELLDFQRLMDIGQLTVCRAAHAPGDRAVPGDGVFQKIAHHGGLALCGQGLEGLINGAVGIHAVVVVGIDDAERLMDECTGTQHGVGGAKGLGTVLGNLIESRHGVKGLLGVAELHLASVWRTQRLQCVAGQTADQVTDLRLDDKHHFIKTGTGRVIDAVVHQNLAVGPHTVHLLVTAIAGAHAGRHDHQCCMHYVFLLLQKCSAFMIPCFRRKSNRLSAEELFCRNLTFPLDFISLCHYNRYVLKKYLRRRFPWKSQK